VGRRGRSSGKGVVLCSGAGEWDQSWGGGCWWAVLLQAVRAPSDRERPILVPKRCCRQPRSREMLLQELAPALALCLVLYRL